MTKVVHTDAFATSGSRAVSLQFRRAQCRRQVVFLSGRQTDGGAQYIARLDTEELRPFAVSKVSQSRSAIAPGIPHDSSERVGLLQSNTPANSRIDQNNVILSVQIGVVSCRGNFHLT